MYEIVLVKNRLLYVEASINGNTSTDCFKMPRPPSTAETSAWPYYNDASALSATTADWQQLTLMFSANSAMSGSMVLEIAGAFWKGQETMAGHVLKLGFLFIYGLFTGTITAKIGNQDNSRTVATIFLQLCSDRHNRSLLPSVLHLLARNPSLSKILPKVMCSPISKLYLMRLTLVLT